tara:strand:+ start:172 stop:600 length:429 start_codon:yes stop_codon:yes gene_type:complete
MNYKIYKIVDNSNDNVYIGQTCRDIRNRITEHKYDFNKRSNKNISSQQILSNGDWSYEIVQSCLTKQVADDLEKYYIQNTPNCINKQKLNFNKKEYYKKFNKKNREKNKDYANNLYHYQNSWGGDKRRDNNLLLIDVEGLFN